MRKTESLVHLKTIENLQEVDINDSDTTISQDKIYFRKKRINELRLRGYTNQQIAQKTGFNLSTIEKDLHVIRENSRQWFETESIKEYCQSLHDGIILYDCGIEELQLLYHEEENNQIKTTIYSKILEFTEKKIKLFEKTNSVKKYFELKNFNSITVNDSRLQSENEVLSDSKIKEKKL